MLRYCCRIFSKIGCLAWNQNWIEISLRQLNEMPRQGNSVKTIASRPVSVVEPRFRALAVAALEDQRSERGKLAGVLHDEIAPVLSAAGLQLDILRMDLIDRVPEIDGRASEIQKLLDVVFKKIRELSNRLSPGLVERVGLRVALEEIVERFRLSFSGDLRLIYHSSEEAPAAVRSAMARIAEEAVSNAVHHARCRLIEVEVSTVLGSSLLQVRDDGIGFEYGAASRAAGLGLPAIENCASRNGLQLTVNGTRGRGTTVLVRWTESGAHAKQLPISFSRKKPRRAPARSTLRKSSVRT
jgi:two-component system NarL family sensor kinase